VAVSLRSYQAGGSGAGRSWVIERRNTRVSSKM